MISFSKHNGTPELRLPLLSREENLGMFELLSFVEFSSLASMSPGNTKRESAGSSWPSVATNLKCYSLNFCIFSDISSVQFSLSVVPTLCDPSTPGLPVHHQFLESTQTHVHWVGDVIQPSHPLSSPSPPALNLSQNQGLFKWVSSSHQVPKIWSFSFNISPTNEHPGLISFRMDWLDLLAVSWPNTELI